MRTIFFSLILIGSVFFMGIISMQATSSYFLMTTKHGKTMLFTSDEERQQVCDKELGTEIDSSVILSQHCLEIDKDTHVNFSWYQSGKPGLVVLAVGKGGHFKEKLPFIREFTKHYDVITFDYEWQNQAPLYKRIARIGQPLKRYFEHNYREVQAIVNFIRQCRQYSSIIGHAECYSAFMFVKAQALTPGGVPLFDKLVLDSVVLSGKNSIKSLFKNPALCLNPLEGESSAIVRTLIGNRFFLKFIDLCSNDYSLSESLVKIDVPVLFIRGQNDSMVSHEDFLTMWELVGSQKAAFITPFQHANSFKRKNARNEYLYIEGLFMQNSFDDFTKKVLQK